MNVKSNFQTRGRQRRVHPILPTLLLLLCIAAPVFAGERYLAPHQPDGVALLPPPPAPDSTEQAADLASARAVFTARTPADTSRAEKDSSLSLFNFASAIGSAFQAGKFPKMEALFQCVRTNISDVINIPKDHWKRSRPYEIDRELSLGNPESSFSYPSGHSTRGSVQALLLAELFPEKREAILVIGRNIGWDRVLIGKHFPSDVYAGRVLGQAIVRELMASPAFLHDLAEAKAEVQAAQPVAIPNK